MKAITGRLSQVAIAIVVIAGLMLVAVNAAFTEFDTYKTTPVSLSVTSSPSLPDAVKAQEAQTVALLFDRDTTTEFTAFDTAEVDTTFATLREVRAIRLYGAAPYTMSVAAYDGSSWSDVSGLQNLDLTTLAAQWHSFKAATPVNATALRFTLAPSSNGTATGIGELEIWTKGMHTNALNGEQRVAQLALGTAGEQIKITSATPINGTIGPLVGTNPDDPADNTFSVNLDMPPHLLKRAYLVYELYGEAHWMGVVRSLNGMAAAGGKLTQGEASWTTQIEPLSPSHLMLGDNTIEFAVPAGSTAVFSVKDLRLIVEVEDGANSVLSLSSNQDDPDNHPDTVYDGDLNSGWAPYPGGSTIQAEQPILELETDKPTQFDSLSLNLVNNLKGTLAIEVLKDGIWQSAGVAEIDATTLIAGWNTIALDRSDALSHLRLIFSGGKGSNGEIKELQLTGSGTGTRDNPPRIAMSFPDAGQFYGRTAYLRGSILPADNGSGAAVLTIADQAVSHDNGAFDYVITKDDAGFTAQGDSESWFVTVTASYPDGEQINHIVNLTQANATPEPIDPQLLNTYTTPLAPGQAKKINYDEAELDVDATAVAADFTLSITPLSKLDMPELDPGMTNVTKGPRKGYRFLPHGTKFANKIKIKLPYKKSAVPPGQTEDDIKTFYFDEESGNWKELERVLVDKTTQEITSYTDHFTDFINATVTVPDSPQAAAFNPTQIKDIKAASPAAKVNLIDAPQANNMGDARLGYAIEVPPGRQGMQPQLAVQYNSSGGNGWMGLGWNVPMQSISIDTRWGVPRYSATEETETYLLNGEQLTPVAHRSALQPRTTEKVFHTRVEGQFRKIVRHGTSPANYWWEVTDKNGSKHLYGGGTDTNGGLGGPTSNSTLVDADGNIARWSLRVSQDTNGNFVKYTCVRVLDSGVKDGVGGVQGSQLYLQDITYTGHNGVAGPYKVSFIRDRDLAETRRPDVRIDARNGFKVVTADLLRKVQVTYNAETVRSYEFKYQEGAFRKTLLVSVSQFDEKNVLFNTHTFEYFDEIRDANGQYQAFAQTAESWNTGADNVKDGLLDQGKASALTGMYTRNIGGHLYIGFNPSSPQKNGSGGAKIGYTDTKTQGRLLMIDINGDGLADKVFDCNSSQSKPSACSQSRFVYRANQAGPGGTTVFSAARPIIGLPGLQESNADMSSFGVEAYGFGGNIFINKSDIFTETNVYFSDVNSDGLPDIVAGGQVLFNRINASGDIEFVADSNQTVYPIGAGAVDAANLLADYTAIYERNIDNYPLLDTVRRWVAPYSGTVSISGNVTLIEDTSTERGLYQTADGVQVSIQHNGSELWPRTTILPDDYTAKVPTGVSAIPVSKGDALYFRVQSIFDGKYDQVEWNPVITYSTAATTTDVNNLDPYTYNALDDMVLAGQRYINIQMPFAGTVHLQGSLQKSAQTSDDVTLEVTLNDSVVFTQTVAWNLLDTVVLNQDIIVQQQDRLFIQLKVDSPIDLSKVKWSQTDKPNLHYISAVDPDITLQDSDGNYIINITPPYDFDMYPLSNLSAPLQTWTAASTGSLTVIPNLTTDGTDTTTNGSVTVTVKKKTELVAKRKITITNGVVSDGTLTANVVAGQQYYFEFSAFDPAIKDKLFGKSIVVSTSGDPDVDGVTAPSEFHSGAPTGLFAQPYRGWAFFGYNGNRARANAAIDQSVLTIDESYRLETARVYIFYPDLDINGWKTHDPYAYSRVDTSVTPTSIVSSSRLGLDYIDIPRPDNYAGARAVSKLSYTDQTADGAGFSGATGSLSSGTMHTEVDFMDLNGDRFPDVIGNGSIQYTNMVGGLEQTARGNPIGNVRKSTNTARSLGYGGNAAEFRGASKNKGTQMATIGFSGSLGDGTNKSDTDLIDINGDGLPDRVSQSGGILMVALNLGYSFAAPEDWGAAVISSGDNTNGSIGGALGFNDGIYSYGGGLTLARSESITRTSLIDVNGDGLIDRVREGSGNVILVNLNQGNQFTADINWNRALDSRFTVNGNTTLGGGGYFTFGIPLCYFACYIVINPGADITETIANQELAIRDLDGDGYPEHMSSTSDDSISAKRSTIGRTNLLRVVNRPFGGAKITLNYARSGNTYAQPQSRWVMDRVEVFDGFVGDGVDTQVSTFQYQNGFYDRREREFYGYKTVISEQRDTSAADALYRSDILTYLNDSYYNKGLVQRTLTLDAFDNKFGESENTYLLRDIKTGNALLDPTNTTATVFPELKRNDKLFYEGLSTAGKSTYVEFDYDTLGNVARYFDAADTGAQDDVEAIIGYFSDTVNYIVDKPNSILVTGDGTLMRQRESTFETGTGNVKQARLYLADGSIAVNDMLYDSYGNLSKNTGPANLSGQRYSLDYTYDTAVNTYVNSVTDSFGYTSSADYEYKYGNLLKTVDINAQPLSYTYDDVGRTQTIVGPYQVGSTYNTIEFSYFPDVAEPYALTKHIDTYRNINDPIETVLFMDGLGRIIQTKKDGTIHTSQDTAAENVMLVSGQVTFDFIGRTVRQKYPVSEPLGLQAKINLTVDSVQATVMTYDILGRVLSTTIPDNTSITMTYGFGEDRNIKTQFKTTVTDANGVKKQSYRDVRNVITAVKEFNKSGTEVIWTSYEYDPLKQITSVTDDLNHLTTVSYDNFGRRTQINNPDTGWLETVYDLASNVTAKITPNLRASGQQISYAYDFTRLKAINYPNFTGNNVAYTYGPPGATDNRANRVVLATSEAGSEERYYGPLGELTKAIKTVITDETPNEPEVYTSTFTYDTWNRQQSMTYPDGEVLTYHYNAGGLLQDASGLKGGYHYNYLKRMEYDKFEQRKFVDLGNNVRTTYNYDPLDRRLFTLKTGKGTGNPFQDLSYTYDDVGNITRLQNLAAVTSPSQMGGTTDQHYVYDDLYRLTHADGTFDIEPTKQHQYKLEMVYNTIHNITFKDQLHQLRQPAGTLITQKKTSYTWNYAYTGAQPHAPTHIGKRSFSYDNNGNQTGWTHDQNGTRRTIIWDEENRIQSIADNGHTKTYKYDDAGQRVIKRGPHGETVYVNPYFVIRNGSVGTKHVFAGTTRLVSKMMKQDAPGANPNGKTPLEKDLYFYHPDHLGSTNYVTDTNGKLYQHLEYFPFGETWVEQGSDTQRIPYLFTSKELDEETGLYYFGARYYDPRTSVWQSADPILGAYLGTSPSKLINQGVFKSKNISLFSYSFLNPVVYKDPDGKSPGDPVSTHSLRRMATNQGIGRGLTGIQYNRAVGRAFQNAMLNSIGLRENFFIMPSPARLQAGGRPGVMPDSRLAVKEFGFSFRGLLKGQPWVRFYRNAHLIEVKAVRGSIGPSHSGHQITGLIDVAARSGAPIPILTLLTTSNTRIGPKTLNYATRRGVALWQAIAIEGANGTIKASPGVLLNPQVLGDGAERRIATPDTGGRDAALRPGVQNPLDPDPATVQ